MFNKDLELLSDETIILDARKHWFVIFLSICWVLAAMLFPIGIAVLALAISPLLLAEILIKIPILFFLYALWLMISWVICFAIITDYMLDIVRITDKRIIDIDQKGFFTRNVATIRLDDIQDVTVESKGFFATLLNFGDLSVQSAGHLNEFVIRGLRGPDRIRTIILEMHERKASAPQKVTLDS